LYHFEGSASLYRFEEFIRDQENNNKTCNKARKAIDNAAIIINNTFDLKAPIIINASFIPICNTIEQCYTGQPEPLEKKDQKIENIVTLRRDQDYDTP
jgi:hypothetical protein